MSPKEVSGALESGAYTSKDHRFSALEHGACKDYRETWFFLCPVSDLFVNRGKKFHCSKTVLVYDMSSHSMDYRWLIASPREYC